MYYEKELKALKKANRYRKRQVVNYDLFDFASNDYLGLSSKKELHKLTCKQIDSLNIHSSKASLLVNGYHKIHQEFEQKLCKINNFEDGIVVGSGFNANIALMEALCRKNDTLFLDELYHASGVLGSNIKGIDVVFFKHNDPTHLKELLKKSNAKRKIVAIEGIYSMDGDMASKEIFDICDKEDAILIVDEAHSSGIIGKNLMGIFDFYNIKPKKNHIKMGTLGKAYGSFGAYILASSHIIDYLINRAKPIIYATSLSLYDTQLAHNSLDYILQNKEQLKKQIKQRQKIVLDIFNIDMQGLILPIDIGSNKKVIEIKELLLKDGYEIGAIRQPTVKSAILRVIARIDYDEDIFLKLCQKIKILL
jgi:8-amino-7-oxononanoate synthase